MGAGVEIRISKVLTSTSWGSYYFEDITQIRRDLIPVSDRYHTVTTHGSYPRVRTPAPAVSVGLQMTDGTVVWGDCVPVSFSGKSGRAVPKDSQALAEWFESDLGAWFPGRSATSWLALETAFLKDYADIPAFIRYGVSQAMVAATAAATKKPLWQIFSEELQLNMPDARIPLHGSCGGDWGETVDSMLARGLKFLPQGQFEFLEDQIGSDGKKLVAWIQGFKARAARFGYTPTVTLDFHGALDDLCDSNLVRIADMIQSFIEAAAPHSCHIESPILAADFATFKKRISELKQILIDRGFKAPSFRLVADEWANTVQDMKELAAAKAVDGIHIKMPDTGALSECAAAVRILREAGTFALLGGSCTETMSGAKCTAHLALVTRPDAVLVKPGMGFDESFAFLDGEMAKALAEAR